MEFNSSQISKFFGSLLETLNLQKEHELALTILPTLSPSRGVQHLLIVGLSGLGITNLQSIEKAKPFENKNLSLCILEYYQSTAETIQNKRKSVNEPSISEQDLDLPHYLALILQSGLSLENAQNLLNYYKHDI